MKRVTSKYPDVALAKALWKAVKVSEADPGRACLVWQAAYDQVCRRGTSCSFGDGERFAPPPRDPDTQRRQNCLDAAHMILRSALSMGRILGNYKVHSGGQEHTRNDRETLAACARYFDADRKRRRPSLEVRSLTPRQVEVMQIASECETNLAETARRMGLHRKTVEQHYRAACKKLGIKAVTGKPKTHSIPLDRRGQEDVAAQSDGLAPPKAPARVKRDKRAGVC